MDFLVSIIIPVWNAERYLNRSIDSVRSQTYTNWELLIVDDGSTDSSIQICEKYSQMDHRIHLIQNQHGGTAKARNTALDIVKGEYIAFLDADDAYHPSFLSRMICSMQEHNADLSLCATIRGTDATKFMRQEKNPFFQMISTDTAFYEMYNGNWTDLIVPVTKIYSRKLFANVRFPDGMFFEDAATMNRAIYYANSVVKTEEPLYFYNITPNSSSVTKCSIELLDREKALRSHWEFFQKENRKDLELMSIPFYLVELISIYHRIEKSDRPEDCQQIRTRFEDVYRMYKRQVHFSEQQKDQILAFRKPIVYDIKNMFKQEGIIRTIVGFIRRKID